MRILRICVIYKFLIPMIGMGTILHENARMKFFHSKLLVFERIAFENLSTILANCRKCERKLYLTSVKLFYARKQVKTVE